VQAVQQAGIDRVGGAPESLQHIGRAEPAMAAQEDLVDDAEPSVLHPARGAHSAAVPCLPAPAAKRRAPSSAPELSAVRPWRNSLASAAASSMPSCSSSDM